MPFVENFILRCDFELLWRLDIINIQFAETVWNMWRWQIILQRFYFFIIRIWAYKIQYNFRDHVDLIWQSNRTIMSGTFYWIRRNLFAKMRSSLKSWNRILWFYNRYRYKIFKAKCSRIWLTNSQPSISSITQLNCFGKSLAAPMVNNRWAESF